MTPRNGLLIAMAVTIILLFALIARGSNAHCNRVCGTITNKESDKKGELWLTLDKKDGNDVAVWVSRDIYDQAKVGQEWCFNHDDYEWNN